MRNFMLDELLRAVADAVMSAHKAVGAHHHDLGHLFRPSRAKAGGLEPVSMPLVLPRAVVREGEEPEGVHDVPLATLVPHQSTVIDSLSLSLPCLIDGLEDGADGAKRLSLVLGPSLPAQHSRLATLSVTFRNSDPPEGMARINDQLLKRF
jgi:hypothetical protein